MRRPTESRRQSSTLHGRRPYSRVTEQNAVVHTWDDFASFVPEKSGGMVPPLFCSITWLPLVPVPAPVAVAPPAIVVMAGIPIVMAKVGTVMVDIGAVVPNRLPVVVPLIMMQAGIVLVQVGTVAVHVTPVLRERECRGRQAEYKDQNRSSQSFVHSFSISSNLTCGAINKTTHERRSFDP